MPSSALCCRSSQAVQTLLGVLLLLLLPVCHGLTDAEIQTIRASGKVTITDDGTTLTLSSNGIPDHDTGTFPAERNPNEIKTQSFRFSVPKNPKDLEDTEVGCLPMGPIGLMASGAAFFSPYTDEKLDAVKNEVFDSCDGHPDQQGVYHYHDKPDCVLQEQGNSGLIGVAFDGFPVYGTHDEKGNKITLGDLDQCHGRYVNGRYQYHATAEFPYILGCFHGEAQIQSGGRCYFAKSSDAVRMVVPGYFSMMLLSIALLVLHAE